MCQIFAGPSNKIRAVLLNKPGLLENLFKKNRDGLGAMYATKKNLLRTPKIVPQDLAAATAFVRQLPDDDRNLVVHFRYKTSGKIDHDNAHPFTVIENEIAMTHNGILSYPTKSDETMCDTRHYIRDVIRPQLEMCPALATNPSWLWLVGQEIGSNRFVLMDRFGKMAFVNKHTGYDFEDIWFANKYSFDAELLDESFAPPPPKHWSHAPASQTTATGYWVGGKFVPYKNSAFTDEEWDDYYAKKNPAAKGSVLALPNVAMPDTESPLQKSAIDSAVTLMDGDISDEVKLDDVELEALREYLWEGITLVDAKAIRSALELAPLTTFDVLFDMADYVPGRPTDQDQYSTLDERISKYLVDRDSEGLAQLVGVSKSRAQNVAEVMVWFGEWHERKEEGTVEAKGTVVEDLQDLIGQAHAISADLEKLDEDETELAADRQMLLEELEEVTAKAVALSGQGSPVTKVMEDAIARLDAVSEMAVH